MSAGFVIACLVVIALMCLAVAVLVHERNLQLKADLATERAEADEYHRQRDQAWAEVRRLSMAAHPSASVLPFERRGRR